MTSDTPSMRCPSCGYEQPRVDTCVRCGIVVGKYRGRPAPAAERLPASRAAAEKPFFGPWILVFALAVAAAGVFEARAKRSRATAPEPSRPSRAAPERPPAEARPEPPSPPAFSDPRPRESEPAPAPVPASEDPVAAPAAAEAPPVSYGGSTFVSWYEGASGYGDAEHEQRRKGTAMAVLFYTDWCGYCRRMDQDILSSPEVASYLGGMAASVKINPERGAGEAALANRYGVHGYPAFFIVAPGGSSRKVHPFRKSGDRVVQMTPAEFVSACRGG